MDRRIREEQDAEFLRSLQEDQERVNFVEISRVMFFFRREWREKKKRDFNVK